MAAKKTTKPKTKKPAVKAKPVKKSVPRIAGLNAPAPRKPKAAKPAAGKIKVAGLTGRAPKVSLKGNKIQVAWAEVKPKLREGSVRYITAASFGGQGRQYETGIEAVMNHFKTIKQPVKRNAVQIALARLVHDGLATVA